MTVEIPVAEERTSRMPTIVPPSWKRTSKVQQSNKGSTIDTRNPQELLKVVKFWNSTLRHTGSKKIISRQPNTHEGHPSNEYYSIHIDFSFPSCLLVVNLDLQEFQKRSLHLDSFACLLGTHNCLSLASSVCSSNRVWSSLPCYVQQVIEIRGLKRNRPCRYAVLH